MTRLTRLAVSLLSSLFFSACGGGAGPATPAAPANQLLASTSIAALAAVSTAQWTFCAAENGACIFTGGQTVRYGAGDRFTSKVFDWAASCSNATFGDPAPGVAKHCEVSSSWVQCAAENGHCGFGDTETVRYGAGSSYRGQTATGGLACNSAVFGDPAPGLAKHCDRAATTWTECARENGRCDFE